MTSPLDDNATSTLSQPLTQSQEVSRGAVRRVASASLVGTSLEFYDFFIFGTASGIVFPSVFFGSLSHTAGTLASFAIFAVTFIVQPAGAIVFGHLGDRVGRKKLTIITLIIMGVGTFGVGLVPSAQTIGIAAPILLVVCRILQGLGVSGEWGGASLLAVEHAPQGRRGFYGAFPMMGLSVGLLLGTGAFSLLPLLPNGAFLSWGWRIPFLSSVLLIVPALYIRTRVEETPIFREAQLRASLEHDRLPAAEVLRHHWRSVLLAIGFKLGGDLHGFMCTAFLASYLVSTLQTPDYWGPLAVAISALVSLPFMPLIGIWSDKIGRRPVLIGGALLGLVLAFPFFWLVNTKSLPLVILATVLVYSFAVQGQGTVLSSATAELFPTRVRYTGLSMAWQLEGVIGGGPAVFVATALVSLAHGATWGVALYMMVGCLITLVACLVAGETRHKNLADG